MTSPSRVRGSIIVVAAVYVVGLLAIVFLPDPIDRGLGAIFGGLRELAPWATQHRVQVAANVLLFAPAGWILAALPRIRSIALPILIVAAVFIETIQAEMLPARDGDIHDIVANVTGGCLGVVLFHALELFNSRKAARRVATSAQRE